MRLPELSTREGFSARVQLVRGALLSFGLPFPPPTLPPTRSAVFSTPVSCMQQSALLFFLKQQSRD